jgi:hypothetical protein
MAGETEVLGENLSSTALATVGPIHDLPRTRTRAPRWEAGE